MTLTVGLCEYHNSVSVSSHHIVINLERVLSLRNVLHLPTTQSNAHVQILGTLVAKLAKNI
jgi:hypothetical protein